MEAGWLAAARRAGAATEVVVRVAARAVAAKEGVGAGLGWEEREGAQAVRAAMEEARAAAEMAAAQAAVARAAVARVVALAARVAAVVAKAVAAKEMVGVALGLAA